MRTGLLTRDRFRLGISILAAISKTSHYSIQYSKLLHCFLQRWIGYARERSQACSLLQSGRLARRHGADICRVGPFAVVWVIWIIPYL